MKFNLTYGVFLFLFFLIGSCQEDKEPEISFSFSSPQPGQLIWNSTPVEFNIPSSFTGSVEVKLDGQTIGTVTQSPYQFNWNTRTVPDGKYSLQAVATSNLGERQETKQEVIVRNNLLTFDVADDHIPAGLRAFIFASDAGGNLIAQREIKNGDRVELLGSEKFNDPTFTVNEAYLSYPGYLQVYSVGEMTRGTWTLNVLDESPSFVGSIEVKSENNSTATFYVSASGDADFIRENSSGILLATTKSPSQLFMREVKETNNKYALLKNVEAGTSLSFPVDKITTPLKTQVVSLTDPNLVSARVKLYGFPQVNNFSEYYSLGDFFRKLQEIKIEYPAQEFGSIGSESYYRNKQVRLYSFHPYKMYDFQTLNAQIYVSSSDGQLVSLSTYGDFDMYAATWMYYSEQTGGLASWVMIGPPGRNQKLRLPDLPFEIINLLPAIKTNQLSYTGVIQVSEFALLHGYAAYREWVAKHGIAGPYQFGNPWKEQLFTETGFTSGRTSAIEVPMLVEKLKIVK